MGNIFAQRAGMALETLIPGPNRDKKIQTMFNVSERMAKYLRAGEHWTLDRLDQASAELGPEFDQQLGLSLDARLDRMEAEIAAIRRQGKP